MTRAEYLREWRKRNPGKTARYSKQYRQVSGLASEQDRRWYDANKKKKAYQVARYAKSNPAILAAANARRRSRTKSGGYTEFDIQVILVNQGCVCVYCRTYLAEYHIDHVTPLASGGANSRENLQLLCPTCNLSKGGLPEEVFRERCVARGMQPNPCPQIAFWYATKWSLAQEFSPNYTELQLPAVRAPKGAHLV